MSVRTVSGLRFCVSTPQDSVGHKTLVDVTGRVNPGPQAVTRSTSVGKTGIGIGVAPNPNAVDATAPYTPTIEVETIEVVASSCTDR